MNQEQMEELGKKGFELLRDLISAEYPYLSPLIYALNGQADWKETGMSTDGSIVFYNPRYVVSELGRKSKGYKMLKSCYLQMMAHCLLGHIWRQPLGDAELWDVCCDLSAELLVKDISGQQCDIRGIQEEKIFHFISSFSAETFHSLAVEEPLGRRIKKRGEKVRRDDHRRWRTDKRKGGEVEGLQKETGGELMKKWENLWKLVFHIPMTKVGEMAGNGLPLSCYSKRLTAAEENESDYRKLLRKYSALKERKTEDFDALDYSWYVLGLELYSNIPLIEYPEASEQRAMDDIVIAIDVSGSCDGKVACRFLRETCNLLRDMGIGSEAVNIRLLECDDQIQKEVVIHSYEDIPDFEEVEIHGFCGTSFVPVFEHIDHLRETGEMEKVRCLLYFSDGMGEFPDHKPDYDVIFVLEPEEIPWQAQQEEWIPEWVEKVRLTEFDIEA